MQRYKARVYTTLKSEHPDTYALSLLAQLRGAGFNDVQTITTSKIIEVEFEAEPDTAHDMIERMCRELLAHPVTELFTIRLNALVERDGRMVEVPPDQVGVPTPPEVIEPAPPPFHENGDIRSFDLSRYHRLEYGPIRFVKAEWKHYQQYGPWPRFVIVHYAILGRQWPLPVRIDLDKRAFLDDIDYRGQGMGYLQIFDAKQRYDEVIREEGARAVAEVIGAGLQSLRRGDIASASNVC